ncbi:hypothetical protein B566_EDAN007665, partial [Ephemera danica]
MNSNETYMGEWVNDCGKLYLFASNEMNFKKSTEFCKNMGMEVLTIDSKEELDCLTKLAKTTLVLYIKSYWTSATCTRCPDDFKWPSGDIVRKDYWDDKQPDFYDKKEKCSSIRLSSAKTLMNDISCSDNLNPVCQKEKSPTPKPVECIGKCPLYNASAVTAKKLKRFVLADQGNFSFVAAPLCNRLYAFSKNLMSHEDATLYCSKLSETLGNCGAYTSTLLNDMDMKQMICLA